MFQYFLSWLPLCLALFSMAVVLAIHRQGKKARLNAEAKFHAMELLFKNARQHNESLTKQLSELRAGAIGMSQKLASLSGRFDDLLDKQSEMEMNDADGRLYSRANKMVELGADLYELMEECDLPKAEAELLLSIKKPRMHR